MLNNTEHNKLDETVKQTLGNYEVSSDISDWGNMEVLLDAAPKSSTFNWKYPLLVFSGIAVLVVGYFIYNSLSSENSDKTEISNPAEIKNPVAPVTTNPNPPAADKINTPVTITKDTAITSPVLPDNTQKTLSVPNHGVGDYTNTATPEKKKKKKETVETSGEEFKGNQDTGFGNVPDSSKNGLNETKEETKKATKNTTPVGWNSLLINVNPDSIRKNRERMKKDTANHNP